MSETLANMTAIDIAQLARSIKIGDLIFIRVSAKAFSEVADATGTWTNHVGVVSNTDSNDPQIGESTFPFSRITTLSKFIERSVQGRVAISRLKFPLSEQQIRHVQLAIDRRSGIFYDTGFNFRSNRQFCSRYAHEVISEATGVSIGKIETFREMVANQPGIKLGFWKLWYLGQIPWERETMTPASLFKSPELDPVFHGSVIIKSS
jgi:hypothetical protein